MSAIERVEAALRKQIDDYRGPPVPHVVTVPAADLRTLLTLARQSDAALSDDRWRGALERRRNIYLAKRNERDALEDATDNAWDRYEFAAEAVEWVAGDIGIVLGERPEDARAALAPQEDDAATEGR